MEFAGTSRVVEYNWMMANLKSRDKGISVKAKKYDKNIGKGTCLIAILLKANSTLINQEGFEVGPII